MLTKHLQLSAAVGLGGAGGCVRTVKGAGGEDFDWESTGGPAMGAAKSTWCAFSGMAMPRWGVFWLYRHAEGVQQCVGLQDSVGEACLVLHGWVGSWLLSVVALDLGVLGQVVMAWS